MEEEECFGQFLSPLPSAFSTINVYYVMHRPANEWASILDGNLIGFGIKDTSGGGY